MPSCIAYGCANKSGRDKKSFFLVPRPINEEEKKRAAKWLHNIGTGFTVNLFKFTNDKRVCEDHFHPDCFQRNLQAELLGYKAYKQLVTGTVPTIFKHKIYDQINMDGSVVFHQTSSAKRIKKIEDNQIIMVEDTTSSIKTQASQVNKSLQSLINTGNELQFYEKNATTIDGKSAHQDYIWSESIKKNKRRAEELLTSDNKKTKVEDVAISNTTHQRQRLRPWLIDQINSGEMPGLIWIDEEKMIFKIPWKHFGRPGYDEYNDAMIFRNWAVHTKRYKAGDQTDISTWKTRFRCALHKLPDIDELNELNETEGANPYRIYQFKRRGELEDSNEEVFEWHAYLKETSSKYVPKEFFRHLVPECMCGFESGMKLEVPNHDYKNTYWLATIIARAPPLILVRYEGLHEKNNEDFWCNTLSDDIHPVGWCARSRHSLKPPRAIQHKEKNWYAYLIKHLTGARKASETLFLKKSHPAHYLRAGQYAEVLDPYNPTCYWLAKIVEVFSGRLNMQYEGWDEMKQEFWCYYLNENLRPVGYGIKHGLTLYPPKGAVAFTHVQFSRLTEKLLTLSKRTDSSVFKSLFVGWTNQKEHNLRLGMKLEAIHPNDPTSVCVASVARIFDNYYFLLKIDNLLSTQDDIITNSFVCHKDSPYIFPIGFCSKNCIVLHQPRGYNGKFTWDGYLKYTKAEPVPADFFQETNNFASMLAVGMKLEAVDKENPTNICVCTISKICDGHIWLNIDGDTRSDQIFHIDSHDIFPVGWCEATGHELQWPRPNTLEQKNRISSLRHTATRKNRLEVLRKGKLREQVVDDTIDLTTKNPKEKDKRQKRQYGRRGVSRSARIVYDEKNDNSITDTSIAIVCINRLSEEYNSEESIKEHFRLDSEGRLPAEVVTIDDDDDDDNKFTEPKSAKVSRYTDSDLNYFSFIRVKPNDLNHIEDDLFEKMLKENDGNQGSHTDEMLSPNSTNRESRRSLNSVVAMLRASRRQGRTHLTQLEQYKQSKVKKAESLSPNAKTTTLADKENVNKQVIDLCNDDDIVTTGSRDPPFIEQNDGSIKIPGKGEYRIVEKIVTKHGDKNKIILKLGKPLQPQSDASSNVKVIPSQFKSSTTPTTNVDDMHLLSNMARSHHGVDEIMRNRFNKVRSLCRDLPKNPLQWTKKHVAQFVKNADMAKYAHSFFEQEVDGHSFLLLTVQEIHHILGVHLGPAIKIHDFIFSLQQLVNDAYINNNDKQGGSIHLSRDTDSIILERESIAPKEESVLEKQGEVSENDKLCSPNMDVVRWLNNSVIPEFLNKGGGEPISPIRAKRSSTFDNEDSTPEKLKSPAAKEGNTSKNIDPGKFTKLEAPVFNRLQAENIPQFKLIPTSELSFLPTYQHNPANINQQLRMIQYRHPGIQIGSEFPMRFGPQLIPIHYLPEQAKESITQTKPNDLQTSRFGTTQVTPVHNFIIPRMPNSLKRPGEVLYPVPVHIPAIPDKTSTQPPSPKVIKTETPTTSISLTTIPVSPHFPLEHIPISSQFPPEHPFHLTYMSNLNVDLESRDLWDKFYNIGTEMILTRLGRRMFPNLQIRITGMDPKSKYVVIVDFAPADHFRYKYEYEATKWLVAGEETTPAPGRVYVHPESPATGEEWMKNVVDFTKCKLTNNITDRRGHILMHSMHKYQPRIQVLYWDGTLPLQINPIELMRLGCRKEFVFPETQFIAVTAYQNSQITQLKIQSNPFARGFRGDWRKYSEGGDKSKRKKKPSIADNKMEEHTDTVPNSDDEDDEEDSYEAPSTT